MRFANSGGRTRDKSAFAYSSAITITNIPAAAYDSKINGKSAIDWLADRQQLKTDKLSSIKREPNAFVQDGAQGWSGGGGAPKKIRAPRLPAEAAGFCYGLKLENAGNYPRFAEIHTLSALKGILADKSPIPAALALGGRRSGERAIGADRAIKALYGRALRCACLSAALYAPRLAAADAQTAYFLMLGEQAYSRGQPLTDSA